MKAFSVRMMDHLRSLAWFIGYGIDAVFTLPLKLKKFEKENVRRILVVDLLYIGDLVATTPALSALREHLPKARISFLLLKEMEELLKEHPSVEEVIAVDQKTVKENPQSLIQRLKDNFDLAILFHPNPTIGSWRMSTILQKAGIPFRIGGARVGLLEGKGFFLHRRAKPRWRLQHKVDDLLDVLETIDVFPRKKELSLAVSSEAERWAGAFLEKHKHKGPLFLFHACPRHESHQWFPERWAELANRLIENSGAMILLTGTADDREYVQWIVRQIHRKEHVIDATGTTLSQIMGLVKKSQIVVSVDTGVMHIAAGLGKPVISLFGAGNPAIWRSYSEHARVIFKENEAHVGCMVHHCYLKGPRYMECMKAISVEDVVAQIPQNVTNSK